MVQLEQSSQRAGLGFWAAKVASRSALVQRSEDSIVNGLMIKSYAIARGASWTGGSHSTCAPASLALHVVNHGIHIRTTHR